MNKGLLAAQSESENLDNKKRWRTYHKSGSHSDDDCYHQRNGKRSSIADSNSKKDETFIADSTMTGYDKCSCKRKVETKYTKIDDKSNPPPGIGCLFTICHLPLSQQAGSFQLLVDSGSSKHFVDPDLIHGLELRMLEYTRIGPLMEIRAAGDKCYAAPQRLYILLLAVHGTDDALRIFKVPTVLTPGLKKKLISRLAAAQKDV